MPGWLWVALGGSLGTLTRYGLSGWINERFTPSPWAIFVVNISGAFLIGLVTEITQDRFLISPDVRRFLTVGFLGGYTTFSTLMYETLQLLQDGQLGRAGVNALGSVAVGLLAVWLGVVTGRLV